MLCRLHMCVCMLTLPGTAYTPPRLLSGFDTPSQPQLPLTSVWLRQLWLCAGP